MAGASEQAAILQPLEFQRCSGPSVWASLKIRSHWNRNDMTLKGPLINVLFDKGQLIIVIRLEAFYL
jgi:hypothetical protein